jgi:hypothetical protein
MVEGGRGARFAKEAFQRKLVGNRLGCEEFQRNMPVEHGIASGIDHTHPPAAEFLDDLVVGYGLADHPDAALTRRPKSILARSAGVKENSAERGERRIREKAPAIAGITKRYIGRIDLDSGRTQNEAIYG